MPVSNLRDIRSCVLLYVNMPIFMLMELFLYVIYGIMCNGFSFRVRRLSTEHVVAHPSPFSLLVRYQSVRHY